MSNLTPIVALKASSSALLLTGNIDIIGNAICKLSNRLRNSPVLAMLDAVRSTVNNIDSEAQLEICEQLEISKEDIAAINKAIESFRSDIEIIGPIIAAIRQVRDALAAPNDIHGENIHETAAFVAECFEAELYNDTTI